ncbi:centrosomal protein of 192 kDa, partial [Neolamprologus brichardi]|uniref:centrosomal protein of 192 kDa n=1 Tax=Neolamprologus brichardi TaxID=32507 RepID=UPI0016439B35
SSGVEQPKFALSFKDDMDNADDFIAAHRLSDKLLKINLDESASTNQGSMLGLGTTQAGSVCGHPTELGTDLSTGLLTFAHFGHKDITDKKSIQAQALPARVENNQVLSEGVGSDHFSDSNSSFLANEKLMSVDSMNSDLTDDDIDVNNLPDDELELYFNKLVPPAMQRGRVEGQEIPATGVPGAADVLSNPSSTEPEQYRDQFLDQSDQKQISRASYGGGGDGSSGSEESGNDGGVSTMPLPAATNVQTTYDALRGLGIVGSSAVGQDEDDNLNGLPVHGRISLPRHTKMGDRVGPVGTGETSSSLGMSGASQRLPHVSWSKALDRQEALYVVTTFICRTSRKQTSWLRPFSSGAAHPDSSDGPSSDSSLANQSYALPDNNSSPLMLSISTIASAIADASISNDPSQLAAMIMELSKKSRARNRAESAKAGPAGSSTEEPTSALHILPEPDQSAILDTLQRSTCVGEMSGFDMEKYLKKVDVSGSSDSLGAHTTLELSSWANNLSSSQRNPQTGHPEKWGSAAQHVESKTSVMEKDIRGESTMAPGSSIPQPSLSSARRSVGSSTHKPPADTVLSHAASSATTCASLGGIKPAEVNIQASNGSPSKTPHKTNKSSAASPGLLRTSPGCMKGQSVLPCHKGSSPYSKHLSESNVRQLTKVDSGYCSNLNIQQTSSSTAPQSSQQWGTASSVSSSVYTGGLGMPPTFSSDGLHYVPIPSFKPQCPGTIDLPHQGDVQSLLTGRALFNSQLAQQYLGPEAPLHPAAYVGATESGLYTVASNPESFMVWVHFKAPQKYTASSGELGPADEYSARVDIEVDSPGPSCVIRSIPLRARSGTARVHAPKDLQVTKLLLLTILVLLSGPQYEVSLKGEVTPEDSGKHALPSAAVCGPGLTNNVPPILSNKQFVAWGGVTLGRAVQQKLVLRNNSTDATQQLRLLIRGQDQDCFQLQSLFSPEERLTRHGELSIRPREDVTVHLLFAPTRVACMLAKLEIKQSGVRPSQPGVKFTIPLSGYGGTSNIILEDQRKRADGYVATLTDIAVGCVSKVCLCVRNTGSRAAFIKAVAFSDVQTRSLMEPSVISLAPSQFVLKERTQEVITVLMKSTQREQNLCQLASALLATIYLFCGDEVSRQQYRRLLQSKPEVARKALSDNSLLKNIDFNEKFLGEEYVAEACDLPQRPNEAHIFYGNMSKVVVSLLGSTKNTDFEESEHALLLPSAKSSSETDSGSSNGNVSLDVLPVKGPQGPALRVAEPSLKASEQLHKQSESWTIHPEQLVLAAPTINGVSTTSHVQIRNNTSRELSFDLSWPAHCLTITPQHGVIEPQCHLQILISPNPSLATKSSLLPWSGQIYVQCDGQQKFIKVQIRRDLALDVSTAPADTSLSALPPQAATPLLPVGRLTTRPSLTPQMPQAMVEINNKTIVFPTTPSGETSEAQLEVQNGNVEVRWYLSSFAPPYVKGVDNSGDVYRATYTAFRCSRVSGTLGAHEKMQVPITFLPRDRGDYAQFWDLECHPVSEPQQKTRIRLQLCGTGTKSGPVGGPQEGDCSLEEVVRRGVYSPQDLYTFPATRVGESSSLKVNVRNNSSDTHELKFVNPSEPFYIKHSRYSLRSQHYLKLPVQFKPSTAGGHSGLLLIQSETSGSLVIQLTGEALP